MWVPQRGPQLAAIEADWCDELLYAGERGGGKSDFQLGYQEDGAIRYGKYHRGIMFRKTYTELEELQGRAMQIFPGEGAIYKTQPSAGYPYGNAWYWPSGAAVKMRYIEAERDYGRYHGHSYNAISMDEVTEYATPEGLLKMLSTLRSAHSIPCTVRLTGNPGGVGHGWVKARYVDVARPYKDPDTGFTRMFIPSKTADNKILLRSDPLYRNRIKAATAGNEMLRRAWLDGDWDVVAGAFFDCWTKARHVISPFAIPDHWLRFRSGDWGSARPFSFGWWAVASDTTRLSSGVVIPRGCMVRYREWYGVKKDDAGNVRANTGLKMTAEEVGAQLWEKERHDPKISYGVLDPAAFSQDGGPSIHERIYQGSGSRVIFRPADNARVARRGHIGGWDQVRARMIGSDDGPMLLVFDTCSDTIRTVPVMQHDSLNIEDIFTDSEDHAVDEIRYGCMSRPWIIRPEIGPRKRDIWALNEDNEEVNWKTA